MTTVKIRAQFRKDTSALWAAANPVLLAGEVGYETDTKKLRIGDSVTAFISLPFIKLSTTEYQALNSILTAMGGLGAAANKLGYFTGAASMGITDLTPFARTLLDDADQAAMRTTLGLIIGTNVAPVANPNFTGTPLAPTAAPGTNTTQIATTAFVQDFSPPGYVEVPGSPFTVSGASPFTVTGLSGYKDILAVGDGITASAAGLRAFRVGNSGGILSTAIYAQAGFGADTSHRVSVSDTAGKTFMYEILGFNSTNAWKPVRVTGDAGASVLPVVIKEATAFDRLQLLNSAAATLGGTLRVYGRD